MANYTLYNQDIPAACFVYQKGTMVRYQAIRPELLPKQIVETTADGFASWIRERAIDINTLQHRNLMYDLLGTRDKLSIALETHMFSLSDTFTCFTEGEFTPRAVLCTPQDQEQVSNYILVSSDTSLRMARIATPNASTDGSFTKTWKFEHGAWWLYKLQPSEASRTEYEISHALLDVGWDAADYEYDGSYRKRIRTKNFVGTDEFFEPYDSLRYMFPDRSDEETVIQENLYSLGETFAKAWLHILIADALFMNTDRHMRNFGVIRSARTGDILRLAPNFDNNQAYKANPGGHYSGALLRGLPIADIREPLAQLVDACRKRPYLQEAVQEGEKYL